MSELMDWMFFMNYCGNSIVHIKHWEGQHSTSNRILKLDWRYNKENGSKAAKKNIKIIMSNLLVPSNDRTTRLPISAAYSVCSSSLGSCPISGWCHRWEQELWKVTHTLDEYQRWKSQCWDVRKTQEECHIDWFDQHGYLQYSYPH